MKPDQSAASPPSLLAPTFFHHIPSTLQVPETPSTIDHNHGTPSIGSLKTPKKCPPLLEQLERYTPRNIPVEGTQILGTPQSTLLYRKQSLMGSGRPYKREMHTIRGYQYLIFTWEIFKANKRYSQPTTAISNQVIYATHTRAGCSQYGKVKTNQDSHFALGNFLQQQAPMRAAGQSNNSSQLFGVFDGHGVNGHHVSAFVSHVYPQNFQNALKEGQQPKRGVNDGIFIGIVQSEENAMRMAFRQTLEDLLHRRPVIECNYSGTTAVVLLIKEDALICANLGDSRAILGTRRNKGEPLNSKRESFVHNEDLTTWLCHPLSKDHKPNDPIEQQRIQLSGGRVAPYCEVNPVTGSRHYIGPARIYVKHGDYPGLAMSRSLGDMVAHSVGASADPDIYRKQRNQEQDKFVIIASDGLWEFVSSEEAIKIVIPFWHKGNPTQACEELTKLAVERWNREESGGSVDDITCIVIFLSHPSVFPTLTEQ